MIDFNIIVMIKFRKKIKKLKDTYVTVLVFNYYYYYFRTIVFG